jgi:hypothetical protein
MTEAHNMAVAALAVPQHDLINFPTLILACALMCAAAFAVLWVTK